MGLDADPNWGKFLNPDPKNFGLTTLVMYNTIVLGVTGLNNEVEVGHDP